MRPSNDGYWGDKITGPHSSYPLPIKLPPPQKKIRILRMTVGTINLDYPLGILSIYLLLAALGGGGQGGILVGRGPN